MAIQVLPEEVVARIAAGEAVERPASAVKELVENAIDAGATAVHIEADAGGRQRIRVSDNGAGISGTDIELAFKRHATSKLNRAEDLNAVSTLGFRGEALASIAAVSRATIITRQRDAKMGATLKLEGGQLQFQGQIGAPAGSVITVENLFFNTPARLKFLKKDITEKRHIYWVVARYAMAYPQIAFALKLDGRERFRSNGRGDLADPASKTFGLSEFKCMLPLQSDEAARPGAIPIAVRGYTSAPSLHRASRDRIILFVNGRAIQDSSLSHAVTQAYDGLLRAGAFPLAVLLISVPPDFVDVNVHPTKAEVRFRDSNLVFTTVQRTVRETLLKAGDIGDLPDGLPARPFDLPGNGEINSQAPWWQPRRDLLIDDDLAYIPEDASAPSKPRTLPLLRVIGQVGATYLIAEGPAGMYLLDQNAAHERVLYQQLCEQMSEGALQTVAVSESQTIALSPSDADLLADVSLLLAGFGFEIEPFGPNTFVLRQVPACAADCQADELVPALLDCLRHGNQNERTAMVALARALAIRRGQVLALDDMQSIVQMLERCPSPQISPSGSKTLIHLSRDDLAHEFGRR